jgi:hypothetical protein
LQARGSSKREYAPGTLRDKLGLRRPANAHIRSTATGPPG